MVPISSRVHRLVTVNCVMLAEDLLGGAVLTLVVANTGLPSAPRDFVRGTEEYPELPLHGALGEAEPMLMHGAGTPGEAKPMLEEGNLDALRTPGGAKANLAGGTPGDITLGGGGLWHRVDITGVG